MIVAGRILSYYIIGILYFMARVTDALKLCTLRHDDKNIHESIIIERLKEDVSLKIDNNYEITLS